jgi:quercetin dioxygenase-like cupin family protein
MSHIAETAVPEQEQDKETGEPGSLIVFDLRKLTEFHEDKPFVQVLSDIGAARLILFTFKAGQQLKEHRTTSQILVQVLRGRVTFSTAANSVKLQAGMVLQLEENVPHSVFAQTDAVMMVTMTPSPSFHSLGLGRNNESGQVPLVSRTPGT